MTDDRRPPRTHFLREKDADTLEASLGALPAPAERPAVVVLVGLPGSGKSHLAREIARRYRATILDSDALRGALFRHPQHTEKEHARLFPALHVLMRRLLERGIPLIVDATNLKEANRRPYYQIAEAVGAPLLIVRVTAPRRVIRARLASRETAPDGLDRSTANLEVYEKMRADVERIRRPHVTVDTLKETGPAVDSIVRQLQSY